MNLVIYHWIWLIPAIIVLIITQTTKNHPSSPLTGTHAQFRDPVTPWAIDRASVQQQYPALINALLGLHNGTRAPNSTAENDEIDVENYPPEAINASEGNADGTSNSSSGSEVVWFSVVAALQDCVGSAALYASLDLK